MQKCVIQLSDLMLGYVFFLGLRRKSCSATEPRKYTPWCVKFRDVLVMNLSSHCRLTQFQIIVDAKVFFSFNSVVIRQFVYFDRRGEILKFKSVVKNGRCMGEATKRMLFIFLIIFLARAEGQPASAATLIGCNLKVFQSLSG